MVSDGAVGAIAGATAGVVALVSSYPLLTISTRRQVDQNAKKASSLAELIRIAKDEGWASLFAGMDVAVVGSAFTYGIFYYWFQVFQGIYRERYSLANSVPLPPSGSLSTATVAGAITAVLTNPIWVVSTVLQVKRRECKNAPSSSSTWQVITELYKEKGLSRFFQGTVPALILTVNPAIQYSAFERLKSSFMSAMKLTKLTPLHVFFLGALAKLIATFLTYPYILIKSRMQVESKQNKPSTSNMSIISRLLDIYQNEGFLGFYKGLDSKLLQSVFNASVLFMVHDYIFRYTKKLLK